MDISAITSLAALLRRSGNKILSGECKFILSAQNLSTLNNLFNNTIEQREIYNASFHVIPGRNNLKLEIYSDLQFLYDFVQRTLSLKLTSEGTIQEGFTVNTSRFKNIKLLELQKLPANCITGIRQLRAQLQFLVCTWSIHSLEEILELGGGDHCSGFVWNELREAVFSHNGLTHLDASLQYTPWLITLDLSYNALTDLEALNALENLKHLNVSYNKLTSLPKFNDMISSGLQVLVLRANFLETVTPLTRITHLRELDISDNCLLEHTMALPPLAHLANLQHLNLCGNPLAHHPHHRAKTCRHLHRDTVTVRFVLDGQAIRDREKEMVGTYRPVLSGSCVNNCLSYGGANNVSLEPPERVGDATERMISVCSASTVSNGHSRKVKAKRRARDAVISDSEENDTLTDSIAGGGSLSSLTNTLGDDDHLATKRQIELLREQYGDNWLQAQAGSLVQEALGLERSDIAAKVAALSSTPYDSDFMMHAADVPRHNVSKGENRELNHLNGKGQNGERAAGSKEGNSPNDDQPVLPQRAKDTDPDISEDEEIDEGEENLYLASVDGSEDPVFLIVTRTHLTERECTHTRECARWPLDTLNRFTYNEEEHSFVLEFDTMRTDKKERRYVIEADNEAVRFNEVLQGIVERNSADESKFISYTCMKCSSTFNMEKNSLYGMKQSVVCPFCKSSLVIQNS